MTRREIRERSWERCLERKEERKLRVKKRGNSCAEGGKERKVATVERDNISERLSIAAFYAN